MASFSRRICSMHTEERMVYQMGKIKSQVGLWLVSGTGSHRYVFKGNRMLSFPPIYSILMYCIRTLETELYEYAAHCCEIQSEYVFILTHTRIHKYVKFVRIVKKETFTTKSSIHNYKYDRYITFRSTFPLSISCRPVHPRLSYHTCCIVIV